ncbi:MAG: PIG-L family deacetylase [Deltaproteobacteria bacterium]|nr:PIG-L family deacetylase [Deltaproteobacteria bacterium]MBW2306351.1 PIG-L family deacetylase [Deltaproteobacteria bacterium]
MKSLRILAVMAHPDDAEVWAGGTIRKALRNGGEGHVAVLTYGPDETRGKEAQEGAKRLGCGIDLFGYRDKNLRDTGEAADALVELMAGLSPRVIIVHNPDDTHPDHEASFLIARRALIHWYDSPRRPEVIPSIFACNSYRGLGLRGPLELDTFVDITSVWEDKIQALLAHRSQQPQRWIQRLELFCRAMGARTGIEMAEGFRRLVMFNETGAVRHLDPELW